MRAVIAWLHPRTGVEQLGTGRGNQCITCEYKSRATLLRYGVRPLLRSGERVHVHVYRDFARRYSAPDYTLIVEGQS